MLINHTHHFITDAEPLVESDTFVERNSCHIDSFTVFVSTMKFEDEIY
jgi:hypothetical protein